MGGRSVEIDKDTKGSTVVDESWIADETSKLRSDVSKVRTGNIREPEVCTDEGHVVLVIRDHLLVFRGVRLRALSGGEYGGRVIGGIEAPGKAFKERAITAEEVLDVEFLREGDGTCGAVAFDTNLEDPVKGTLIVGGVVGGEVANEVGPKGGVVVDDNAVINP